MQQLAGIREAAQSRLRRKRVTRDHSPSAMFTSQRSAKLIWLESSAGSNTSHVDIPTMNALSEHAESAFNKFGIETSNVLAIVDLRTIDCDFAYISGSLIEGYGNDRSDVDIYVVSDERPNGDIVTHKATHSIVIGLIGHRRVDFEFWKRETLYSSIARLTSLRLGDDFVADALGSAEELLLHRLSRGIPIVNDGAFFDIRNELDTARLARYQTQQAIHRIDGACEDIFGMLDSKDYFSSVLRTRDLLGLVVDAYCHSQGQTNPLPKWRAHRLKSLAPGNMSLDIEQTFWKLTLSAIETVNEQTSSHYAHTAVELSERVVRWIQG